MKRRFTKPETDPNALLHNMLPEGFLRALDLVFISVYTESQF